MSLGDGWARDVSPGRPIAADTPVEGRRWSLTFHRARVATSLDEAEVTIDATGVFRGQEAASAPKRGLVLVRVPATGRWAEATWRVDTGFGQSDVTATARAVVPLADLGDPPVGPDGLPIQVIVLDERAGVSMIDSSSWALAGVIGHVTLRAEDQ